MFEQLSTIIQLVVYWLCYLSGLLLHSMLYRRTQRIKTTNTLQEDIHMNIKLSLELIKKLIRKGERRILRLAAALLVKSNIHDLYFFAQCCVEAGKPVENNSHINVGQLTVSIKEGSPYEIQDK